ncbi:hypothetical protein HDU76_008578 [Blyttiomyces sp. JEL0837]|nr:hypothetical protein HDU76_008578 [Blyttiomyces sp. JEL0837]
MVEEVATSPSHHHKILNPNKTVRDLQARHLQMIALGGTIGTGLFLASGGVIASAGPLGALIAYIIVGMMIWGVVTSLGEMSTLIPTSGAFGELSSRYVDPAMGFTVGWNYWAQWAITLPAELSAGGIIMTYWAPNIQPWVWAIVFIVPLFLINFIGVKGFGETEYWLSLIKVLAIVIFILVAFAVICGASNLGPIGFNNWSSAIPNAPIGESSSVDGSHSLKVFVALLGAFPTAAYSYGGTEIVGVTAGECRNPRKNVPKAIRGTFWRIVLFYVLGILFLGMIIPADDADLGNSSGDIRVAPFTRVYNLVGIAVAADIMNAIILVAVLSAANSSIYACSRTLMGLAENGLAPKFVAYVDKRGTPVVSLAVSLAFGCLAFLATIWGNGIVFNLFLNILGVASILSWMSINVTHLRFRWGWMAQGRSMADLPYVAPFFPYADYLSLLIGTFVIAGLIMSAALTPFDYSLDSSLYVGLPFFFFMYVLYVVGSMLGLTKTKYKGLVPYADMDFDTGRHIDEPEEVQEGEKKKGVVGWIVEYLA